MDQLELLLKFFAGGIAVSLVVGVAFTVIEYRKWRFPFWIVLLSLLSFLYPVFILPVVFHAERRIMRKQKMDERIAKLKIATGWYVLIGFILMNIAFTYICNRTVDREYSEELAIICCYFAIFLILPFVFWLNSKFDAMLGVSRKTPVRQVE